MIICRECLGTSVQRAMWCRPNDKDRAVDDFGDYDEDTFGYTFCETCAEKETAFRGAPHPVLLDNEASWVCDSCQASEHPGIVVKSVSPCLWEIAKCEACDLYRDAEHAAGAVARSKITAAGGGGTVFCSSSRAIIWADGK